jgi:glycosyltransferase involved in cell wall biosynthesis
MAGLVSALICTRDRPNSAPIAVGSILSSSEADFELLVIDQSDGTETERALERFATDSRFKYVRARSRGKGAALNHGLRLARGEVVVCTDDDCEASPGWVAAMGQVFEEEPSAAVAFCNVAAPPHDRTAGYVPSHEQPRRMLRSIRELCAPGRGLGAGMALKRDVVMGIGGFDEWLGPGARFPAAEDMDITARVLLRGWHVYITGDRPIVHHGFRTMAEGREHARRDWVALGAVCAKPLRAGYWSAAMLPVWELSVNAIWPPLADLMKLRRPRGLARITSFLHGFTNGLLTAVDRDTLTFANVP